MLDSGANRDDELKDLLHFATLQEAEACLTRLDELLRKLQSERNAAEVKSVRDVARLGRKRAEMIARNPKINEKKRLEKQEIAQWFAIWLQTPEAFFDWLEVRKSTVEFRERFPTVEEAR